MMPYQTEKQPMFENLKEAERKYENIGEQLMQPEVVCDTQLFKKLMKNSFSESFFSELRLNFIPIFSSFIISLPLSRS